MVKPLFRRLSVLHTISNNFLNYVRTWLDKGFYQKVGVQKLLFKEDECELSIFTYSKEKGWGKSVKVYPFHILDNDFSGEYENEDDWIEKIPSALLKEIKSSIPTVLVLPDSSVRVSQLELVNGSKQDKKYVEWLAKKNVSPDGKYTIKVNLHKEYFVATGYSDKVVKAMSRMFDGVNVDRILPEFSVFENVKKLAQKVIVFFYKNSVSIVYYNKISEVSYFRRVDIVAFDESTIESVYRFCCTILEFFRVQVDGCNTLYKVQVSDFNDDLLSDLPWVKLDDRFSNSLISDLSINDIYFLRSLAFQVDIV